MTAAEVIPVAVTQERYPELPVYLMTREEFEVRRMAAKWMLSQTAKPTAAAVPHGTAKGWRWFGCRCEPCSAAWNSRPVCHGTTTAYSFRHCRCRPCLDAWNAYNRARRAAKR